MKELLQINLQKDLESNDILIFQDGQWTNVRKDEFLSGCLKDIKQLKEDNENLRDRVEKLEGAVRELRGED